MNRQQILDKYYSNGAKQLNKVVNSILINFGGIYDKDYDDFYSLANMVFIDVIETWDGKQSFDGYLYSCLSNKIKSEITARNRQKRKADRMSVPIDTPIGEDGKTTIADMIPSNFSIESELTEMFGEEYDERIEKYLRRLTKVQRQIVEMKMSDIPVNVIKDRLGITNKQYEKHCEEIKRFENICVLYSK